MYVYTISSIKMKSHCTSTTMGSLIVSFFRLTMSRDTRGAGRGTNQGNAADMRAMFTDLMREMLRDARRAVPNAGNGGGPVVQAPRVDFAKFARITLTLVGRRSTERSRPQMFRIGWIAVIVSSTTWVSKMR